MSAHLTKASRLKTPLIRTEASLILCLSGSDCPPSPLPPAFLQFCNDYFICVDILSMCLSVLCAPGAEEDVGSPEIEVIDGCEAIV